ncbi:MAG: CDP-diacylglycerol--serine O-phosphatidyltransferase [Cyclobacteriaceae bacterium]|nr:CDP-diacylglycerol--serine O-phosphatidyltransferase [Cyclobacteriaceae bacterium]
MSLLRHIPNALTCANLVCGCFGIISLFTNTVEPAYFIWAACVFDFFDGFAARLLKVSSPIGKELDSLADVVSFGVLPALAMYTWIGVESVHTYLPYVAILIAVFSAWRLAKFNIDENQSDSFIGVPTPANALFISALPFLPEALRIAVFSPYVLAAIAIVFSLLLVAPLPLFALKFKSFSWQGNQPRFTFLAVSVLLLAAFHAGAIPFIILFYIGISLGSRLAGVETK